jgi:uncharacterized protein YkwD
MSRRPRLVVGAVALGVAFAASPWLAAARRDGDKALAPAAVAPLVNAAKELAKAGRGDELDEVLDLLHQFGMEPGARDKLAVACRKDAAKQKKPLPSVPSVARSLQKVAADLAAATSQLPVDDQPQLARAILELDDSVEAAQKLLGRTKVAGAGGDEWLTEANRERRLRKATIADAVVKARALDFEVKCEPSRSPWLAVVKDRAPLVARCRDVVLHTVWPAEKAERVLKQVMRSLALDSFLLTGELAPPHWSVQTFHVLDSESDYRAAAAAAHDQHAIDDREFAEAQKLRAFFVKRDMVDCDVTESGLESVILSSLVSDSVWKGSEGAVVGHAQASLRCGLVNWTALTMLGTRMPDYAVEESKERPERTGWTAGMGEQQKKEFDRLLVLSEAGIAGGRAWLQYLAEHHQEPPYSATLVDQEGRLNGEPLLKATFVFEMLSQNGTLLQLFRRMPDVFPEHTDEQIAETALARPLSVFDAEWREWFVPPRHGLAQRLAAPAAAAVKATPEEQQTLDALNTLRKRAGLAKTPVEFDGPTSDACRRHARYLALNPDQLDRWPDAHEEYPDRKGFDVDGARAGTSSVIAPGVANGREALDGWMATFYHRTPLLDPGLVRIGYAIEGKCAVLDCESFVRPKALLDSDSLTDTGTTPDWWGVAWPPDNATDVPTHYSRELPQPVPGEDESKMGYPVTFQIDRQCFSSPVVELTLHLGNAQGKVVPCHFSSPQKPTNPRLAPDGEWCLIPREPLQSGASYAVTATIEVVAKRRATGHFAWSFRCGK